jgi:hypothetical protein
MNTENILSAKYQARQLADHAMIAHYTEGDYTKSYHIARMHEEFSKLADQMGYDVILRSAETENEAA